MLRIIALFNAFFILALTCTSNTIHVPDDCPTIQAGIDSASTGDTVLVSPGTYVENINFLGKAITVKSSLGKEVTVIDGGEPVDPMYGSVVTFNNSEGLDSVIDGFTLTNGIGSEPSTFVGHAGGGIFCYKSSPTIMNNNIVFNNTNGGGGMWINGNPMIINNIINNNTAFPNPNPSGNGGGILCSNSENTILINNIISSNKSDKGGGIFHTSYLSKLILINNTITNNQAKLYGGGLYGWSTTIQSISNSIIWNNLSRKGIDLYLKEYNEFTISHSVIKEGLSTIYTGPGCDLNIGTGMIYSDPLFINEINKDYHLSYLSPCRDSGNNNYITELIDFEGDPRINTNVVDIGADEYYNHFYCTGDFEPFSSVVGKFIGSPGAEPVGLFIGSGVLTAPIQHTWGYFYLKSPCFFVQLGQIPADGLLTIREILPPTPTAPYDIPMQAIIGWKLSNLFTLGVR